MLLWIEIRWVKKINSGLEESDGMPNSERK